MNKEKRTELNIETNINYWFLYLTQGCKNIISDMYKATAVVGYCGFLLLLWFFRAKIFGFGDKAALSGFFELLFLLVFQIFAVCSIFLLVVMLGIPWGANMIANNLYRIGLVNHIGEAPLLISKYKDKNNPNVTVLEFESNGISLSDWIDSRLRIESALNKHVVKIEEGKNKRRILLFTLPARCSLPQKLYWHESYLSCENFNLVLGESLLGREMVNLSIIPHILLGGASGSGKSVLLKFLLMQCIRKGAVVCIADFKGGVDFPTMWHQCCRFIIEETELLDTLTNIVDELERRKEAFRKVGSANIDEYNQITGDTLPRIIFACDEVAEVLDKNGLPKDAKELVTKIENKLSIIARQGRAFGVHLILATQRPDATILPGQIRNNIDCRVCGRADNVLSQIILDRTDASDLIPKDAQGRFLLHDGTIIQSYLFDEKTELLNI